MTHPCFACHEVLTNNVSGLCDNCEDRAMNDAEYEREAAADNARYEEEKRVAREAALDAAADEFERKLNECAPDHAEYDYERELREIVDAAEDFNTQQDGHPTHD